MIVLWSNRTLMCFLKASVIVFSPGSGSPKDYPLTSKIYKKYKGKKRITYIDDQLIRGYKQGEWISYHENGKLKEKGKYNEFEIKLGEWEYYHENGELEKGYLDNLKPNGKGQWKLLKYNK